MVDVSPRKALCACVGDTSVPAVVFLFGSQTHRLTGTLPSARARVPELVPPAKKKKSRRLPIGSGGPRLDCWGWGVFRLERQEGAADLSSLSEDGVSGGGLIASVIRIQDYGACMRGSGERCCDKREKQMSSRLTPPRVSLQ